MWIILVVIVVAAVIVAKNKGDRGNYEAQGPEDEKIAQSEVSLMFAEHICGLFREDGDYYRWLMVNTKERHIRMDFTRQGVHCQKIEVNRYRLQEKGTYVEDEDGFGFGASGYQDLPNGKYVQAFRRYILKALTTRFPYLVINNADCDCIKISESAKKSW